MAIHFKPEKAEVWGLQYHPDYEYHQMVNLSAERKEQMLEKKRFEDEGAFNKHMDYIKEEEKKLEFKDRTCEVRNWLDFIKSQQN
jgi:GMP synthase (glutamine-hydrolysing)